MESKHHELLVIAILSIVVMAEVAIYPKTSTAERSDNLSFVRIRDDQFRPVQIPTSKPTLYEVPLQSQPVPPSTPERIQPTAKVKVIDDFATPSPIGSWTIDPEVSWYGPGFYGNRTACGLAYTKTILGVAHRSLPCGTLVEFRWRGKSAVVPVIDRGPYVRGRDWDLSGGLCTLLEHCFTGPIEWRFAP